MPRSLSTDRDDDVTLFDIVSAIVRRKKLLIAVPFVTTTVAVVISLVMPNMYKATTRLLPPQQSQSSAAGLLSQLGGVASLATGMTGLKNPNDMYVAMLKSRTVADKIIAKYDLKKLYEVDSQEKARKELENSSVIAAGKDGLITVDVELPDQQLSPKIANAYVAELTELTKTLAVTEASRRRIFYEQQLELAKNNLSKAEVSLKSGLESHGVISVDGESRAIVETIGKLRAQASAKEIELRAMDAFVTTSNPTYRRAQEELTSLRNELSKLENGRSSTATQTQKIEGGKDGFENIKTLRDVKYFQMLYEILAKQYEVARLDEAKEPAIIQVLDEAIVPEKKSKPRRSLIVLGGAFGGFFVALAWIVFSLVVRKSLSANGFSSWSDMKRQVQRG